jgi:hypothetical protein
MGVSSVTYRMAVHVPTAPLVDHDRHGYMPWPQISGTAPTPGANALASPRGFEPLLPP